MIRYDPHEYCTKDKIKKKYPNLIKLKSVQINYSRISIPRSLGDIRKNFVL